MKTVEFENFKEFILYLYIYVAYSDGVIQNEEKSLILGYMNKLFGQQTNVHDLYDKWVDIFEKTANDAESHIREGVSKFSDIEFHKKYKIFIQLYDIIGADGVIEASEKDSIEKLKQIIELEVHD